MKQTDKLLLGIVGGILLLVISAFIFVLRQPAPEYQPDNTPEQIAHNYLLALRQQDYERAYSYLSPDLIRYPHTLNQFIQDVERNSWNFRLDNEVSLAVQSTSIINNSATVKIEETRFYHSGLFDNSQSTDSFTIQLSQQNNRWQITQADSYWISCWHSSATYCR